MQSVFPPTPNEVSYDDLAELYAYPVERPWVRANFVESLDGAAQGSDHKSGTLSSRADKRLFGLLRSLADVIVVGAHTTRTEGYLPVTATETRAGLRSRLGLTPVPALAVVSRSLELDDGLIEHAGEPTIVITTESAPAARREELATVTPVITAGRDDVDLAFAVEQLVARGFSRMLCEGGPTLMRDLVAAGRVDEICLTIAPLIVAGDRLRMTHGPDIDRPATFTLRHLLEEDSFLFCRYTRN
ncbi:MAG TPA: pyrimidine reductase family protein [Nocardioidaceae bacterium]|nr:pyrimidine reductase family protein [Nocardioidaceae bacterium]